MPERRIDLDHELRLDAEALGAVAVALLDAALGVAAVAAHVPFAGGAGGQGTGSGRRTMPTTRSPGATPRSRCRARRPGRRHRAPARSGAVPDLRRRRMGHVPQRPLHRARHQGARRLRRRALPRRAGFAVKVDPASAILGVLLEPASVVAKAWDHIERIGRALAVWQPRSVLVTGAGPIGLLAALIGAQRGLDVHVLDRDDGRAEAATGARSRRDLSHRRSSSVERSRPTS